MLVNPRERYYWNQGYKEGYKEGFNEGFKEGFNEIMLEIAKNMLNEAFPVNKIVKYTNLSEEDILKLKVSIIQN